MKHEREIAHMLPGLETPEDFKLAFAGVLRNTPDLMEQISLTRSFLGILTVLDPDSIDGFFGIRIVEKNSQRPEDEDCFSYVAGRKVDIQKFHDEMFETHELSFSPVSGAYALYLNEKDCEVEGKHIGRVNNELKVISKWGLYGHVYEHLPEMVPTQYGNKIAYYLPPKVS
jgi:hypothetical protein